jgi:FkbM family methyltransferase
MHISARGAAMFEHQGVWLPDGEKHFPDWMTKNGEVVDGRGTYQIKKLREAMGWVKKFRTAVDVGAHVGLWAMHLSRKFDYLHAFEPVHQFRQCFERNLGGARNISLYACALGSATGRVRMSIDPADTGGTHVAATAEAGDTVLRKLDEFDLVDVDFIKIDCEGYEAQVIHGARETIRRCRPCLIVEQKAHKLGPNFGIKGTPAVDALLALGAKQRKVMSGDYILSFD